MATQAHCAYCFETLAAHFEHRQPLSLAQVVQLWDQYHASSEDTAEDARDEDVQNGGPDTTVLRSAAISRLLHHEREPSAGSSNSSSSSTPVSSVGGASSGRSSGQASSQTSLASTLAKKSEREAHPLFVTWNTISRSGGHKTLRGCIGTFEAKELEGGLRSYATTSAFRDERFSPIPASLMPSLSNAVTLLTNFSEPTPDPLDWTLGTHGIRISFTSRGRRLGATYLPDVASEQGWTKDETLQSLMRKAGWSGSSSGWKRAWKDGDGQLIRYEGKAVALEYREWKEWRDWVADA